MRPSPIAQTGTTTTAAMMAELTPAASEDEPPLVAPTEGVAVAVVDEAEAAGVAVPVALAVEAVRCESAQGFFYQKAHARRDLIEVGDLRSKTNKVHIRAVVLAKPASTPRAQYASNTRIALDACSGAIAESQVTETAEVIS